MLKRVRKSVFKYRVYILLFFCLGLIWDIFFNPRISDLVVLILGFLWILLISTFRFKPQISFVFAAAVYGISFIFQFFGKEVVIEKGASWFFVFLLIGLVQTFIESFFRNEKKS